MSASDIRAWAVETKRRLEQEIRSQVATDIRLEIETALRADLERELRPVIEAEIRSRITSEIEREVREELTQVEITRLKLASQEMEAIQQEARKEIFIEIRMELEENGYPEIYEEVVCDLKSRIIQEGGDYLRDEAEQFARNKLQMDAAPKIIEEMKAEFYASEAPRLEKSIRTALTRQLRRELRDELKREIEVEFREAMITELEITLDR
jgi:hypothetical protein